MDLTMPDCEELDIDRVDPAQLDLAMLTSRQRDTTLETTRDKFQENLKQYLDREDGLWKQIGGHLNELKFSMQTLDKNLEKAIDPNVGNNLSIKLEAIEKEIDTLTQSLSTFEEKVEQQELSTRSHQQNKTSLIDSLDIKILSKMDIPQKDNKLGVVYNWILGCLFFTKKNIIEFCVEQKLILERPPPPPPVTVPAGGLFACGARKVIPPREVSMEDKQLLEQQYSWIAFRKFVFSEQGQFCQKLKMFNPNQIKPFQQMLMDEMINEKKDILKGIFEIDIKDQVRIIIEANECLHKLNALEKAQDKSAQKERQEFEIKQQQLAQKENEKQTIKSLIETIETKKRNVKKLSDTVTNILKYLNLKINTMETNAQNNDKEANELNMQISDLQNTIQMELIQVQEKQRKVEDDMIKERIQKEKEEREEIEKKIKEEEQKNKENEKQEKQEKNNEIDEDDVHHSHKSIVSDKNQNSEEDQDKYDDDDDEDNQERQQLIPLSQDPMIQNIQRTMFPHLLKIEQNTNKQKKVGGSIFSTVLNGKKKT